MVPVFEKGTFVLSLSSRLWHFDLFLYEFPTRKTLFPCLSFFSSSSSIIIYHIIISWATSRFQHPHDYHHGHDRHNHYHPHQNLLPHITKYIAKPDCLPHLATIRPMGKGNNLANGNKEENWSACMRKMKYILGLWSYYALFWSWGIWYCVLGYILDKFGIFTWKCFWKAPTAEYCQSRQWRTKNRI